MYIVKTILGVTAVIEFFIVFACLLANIVDRFYQFADIVFPVFGIHYNLQSTITAIYGAIGALFLKKFLEKRKKINIPDLIIEYKQKLSIFQLILYNIIFIGLIYLGNILLGRFDNFNINMKQKYGR